MKAERRGFGLRCGNISYKIIDIGNNPNQGLRNTTEYICKAVNNHDRLVEALRAFVEAYEKSLQLEKTDQALKLAREAFAELEGEK